jgi:ferrochelatase
MNRYSASTDFRHGAASRTGVLLVQLGTPAAPTAAAVRPYLKQFLGDPRVVEIPRLVWWPLLHGVILRTRPARSAHKYASIWTDEGSPLMVHSVRQTKLLRGALGEAGHDVDVELAMRYGEPSMARVLAHLRDRSVTRLLVLPLYPQYAGATTGTVIDELGRVLRGWRNVPELRWVRGFHDDPLYIEAVAKHIEQYWQRNGRGEKLVFSFHGVPRRSLNQGDPYHCECLVTARRVAERLQLPRDAWQVTFQSRFGRAQWLQPYTEPTLVALARAGTRRVDVVCPGFISDCLETLEEIGMEAKAAFLQAGGEALAAIPCLNDSPGLIAALKGVVERHTAGWPVARLTPEGQACQERELLERQARAQALGARQ